MKHILCITSGLTGVLNASFELVNRLQALGYRVTYLSVSPVKERVEAQGISYVQLPLFNPNPIPELPPSIGLLAKFQKIGQRTFQKKARLLDGIKNLELEKHAEIIQSLSPDIAIVDMEIHESILNLFSIKIPTVLLSQWFSSWKSKKLPPLGSIVIPGQGLRGSYWGIEWIWFRKTVRKRLDTFKKSLVGGIDRGDVLRLFAKQTGFPLSQLDWFKSPPPFIYRTLPVLSMTSQALEFPHQVRPYLHYIGPMVFTQRKEVQVDPNVLKKVNQMTERKAATSRPLIYCSVSSMDVGDRSFLLKIKQVFAQRPDWLLVIALGGKLEEDFLEPIPSNVLALNFAPQLDLLKEADCSINHGGIHTINECIHFQVPMLVYSGKKYDQNGCAARVAYHGIGLIGDKDTDDVKTIENKLERILTEQSFQNNLNKVNADYQDKKKNNDLDKMIRTFINDRKT